MKSRFRLLYRKIRIKYFGDAVKLWQFKDDNYLNFGDLLSSDIVKKLFPNQKFEIFESQNPPNTRVDIISTGSILTRFWDVDYQLFVWGSGIIRKDGGNLSNKNLVFKACRGNLTRKRLNKKYKDIPIGDPGLLANLIYTNKIKKSNKIGIIPHISDENNDLIEKAKNDPKKYFVIDIKRRPKYVIDDIRQCKVILSSSLHGLIMADSFGIPNVHVIFSDKLIGGDYKFRDYYTATNKNYYSITPNKIFDDSEIENVVNNYKQIDNLKKIQNDLIKAFPFK